VVIPRETAVAELAPIAESLCRLAQRLAIDSARPVAARTRHDREYARPTRLVTRLRGIQRAAGQNAERVADRHGLHLSMDIKPPDWQAMPVSAHVQSSISYRGGSKSMGLPGSISRNLADLPLPSVEPRRVSILRDESFTAPDCS